MAMALIAGSCSFLQDACANTPIFVYGNRDLLLSFRKTGAGASSSDVEVNIGQASIYYSAVPGSTNIINQYSISQLTNAFDNLDNMSWSVGGCVPLNDTGNGSVPLKTLWVTAPRVDPAVQAAPWVRNGPTTQGTTASKMVSILQNASFYSGTVSANGMNNTASLVAVPVGSSHEYGFFMGAQGTYISTFQGDVENTTPSDFDSAGQPSRSDLYELRPDTTATQPPGKYLGYFELRPTGTMVFVAATGAPAAPLLNVSVNSGVNTISFPTTVGATYTLYYTNAAGLFAPTTTWPFAATNITGDGTIKSFQDTSADANRFYRVKAH